MKVDASFPKKSYKGFRLEVTVQPHDRRGLLMWLRAPKSSDRTRAGLAGIKPLSSLEGILCKGKWGGIQPGSVCAQCVAAWLPSPGAE